MPSKHLYANNASTTLVSLSGTTGTSLEVSSSTGFPVPTPYNGGVEDYFCTLRRTSDGALEIIRVLGITGTTWLITRGEQGTTPLTFVAGDLVSLRITAEGLARFAQLGAKVGENVFTNPIQAPAGTLDNNPMTNLQFEGLHCCSLRKVTSQTTGTVLQYDTAYVNSKGYWNSSTKAVSGPFAYGLVEAAGNLVNGSGVSKTVTVTLSIAGVPRRAHKLTIPAGSEDCFSLTFFGYLSGAVEISISPTLTSSGITFQGTDQGGNGTFSTFTMLPWSR